MIGFQFQQCPCYSYTNYNELQKQLHYDQIGDTQIDQEQQIIEYFIDRSRCLRLSDLIYSIKVKFIKFHLGQLLQLFKAMLEKVVEIEKLGLQHNYLDQTRIWITLNQNSPPLDITYQKIQYKINFTGYQCQLYEINFDESLKASEKIQIIISDILRDFQASKITCTNDQKILKDVINQIYEPIIQQCSKCKINETITKISNLQIYFSSSDFLTIQPFLVQSNLIHVFENVIGNNYLTSIGKFSYYELNADLLNNIQGQMTQLILFFLLYFFIKVYRKYFYMNCFTIKQIYSAKKSQSKALEYFSIKFYSLNMNLFKLLNLYTKKGLTQLFYANSWDLIFKTIMYLVSKNISGLRYLISDFISISYLGLIFIFICSYFRNYNQKIQVQQLRIKQHEGVILFKKLSFLTILIAGQNYQVYQSVILTIIIFCYTLFVLFIRSSSTIIDTFVIIWMEAPIMIFTLLSLVYCTDFKQFSSQDQKTYTAFIQMGILIIALFGPIIKTGVLFYKKIKLKMEKRQKQKALSNLLVINNLIVLQI